ncbi:putative odorant receptor 92a isoform X3 [Polyergus mexicanus]|uniref:putative odorant receptor 92a isoform X3 n=1 Tax=Polyergus mexicanus TaxID=615972 RepID=UPI0038B5CA6B
MANTLTIEKLIAFLKVDLLFACCWPLPLTATKFEIIRNKIFRCLSILHGLIMMIAILYTIYTNQSDLFLIMKLCCELCTTTEVPLQIICFSMQYDRLQVCANIFIALLLWFVSARCDILSSRFRAVTKFAELRACVEEHQELLWYGKKVTLSIRYVMLASLAVSTIVIIFTGCTFLSRQPMSVKSTFLIFFISSLAKVYLCAWPADHLLSASTDITHAAYNSMWYNGKIDFQKNFLHILLRGEKPIAVNVPCMLPTVSLNYYASYVSTAFSYLATFRVLLEEDDD